MNCNWAEYQRECGHLFWSSLLEHTGGNVAQAARISGVNRTDLYKVLARLHIRAVPNPAYQHRGSNWDAPVPGLVEWIDGKAPKVHQ